MADYAAAIRMADPTTPGTDPASVTLAHHRTPRAEVRAEVLSGGHVLHLAVACCVFNDLLRLAGERDILVTALEVSADGGFAGDPAVSTGIVYTIDLGADADEAELRRLVADCEQDASIPLTLRRGTEVRAGEITVRAVR